MPIYTSPNGTGIVGLLQYANSVTNYLFGDFLILAIFIIIFASIKSRQFPTGEALLAASFISMGSSILLWPLGIISEYVIAVTVILVPLSLWLTWRQ